MGREFEEPHIEFPSGVLLSLDAKSQRMDAFEPALNKQKRKSHSLTRMALWY
jgi:hypothetical protein